MKRTCGVLVALIAVVLAGATPAIASEKTPSKFASSTDADLQKKIDAHIAKYGGKQVGKNQISWENPRAVMTFPAPTRSADRTALARIACQTEWFCLYEHAWSDRDGGGVLALHDYGVYYFYEYGWNDIASAWENTQTGHARGNVFDTWDGQWTYIFGGCAYDYQSYVGDLYNDKADSAALLAKC